MYLLSWVNEQILLCLRFASYSQRTMNDVTSLLLMYKKVLGSVGLDETGKEKAKLRGIGLVVSCVDLGQSLMQSLCAVSPL
jgi:hypothetical protein